MSRLGFRWMLVPVVIGALALSACTGPAPAVVAVPKVRVPIGCADILSPTAASKVVGEKLVDVQDERSRPANIADIAARQRGVLQCAWTPDDLEEDVAQDGVFVSIAPEAASDFRNNIEGLKSDDPVLGKSRSGSPLSFAGCTVHEGFVCDGQALFGKYFVSVYLDVSPGGNSDSGSDTSAPIDNVLGSINSALAKSGAALAAWKAPITTLPTFCSPRARRAEKSSRVVEGALGMKDLQAEGASADGHDSDAIRIAESPTGFTTCSWSDPTLGAVRGGASVRILRGASWAVLGLSAAHPTTAGTQQTFTRVKVAGTTVAVLGCDDGGCDSYFGIANNAVQFLFPDHGATKNAAALKAIATAIASS